MPLQYRFCKNRSQVANPSPPSSINSSHALLHASSKFSRQQCKFTLVQVLKPSQFLEPYQLRLILSMCRLKDDPGDKVDVFHQLRTLDDANVHSPKAEIKLDIDSIHRLNLVGI